MGSNSATYAFAACTPNVTGGLSSQLSESVAHTKRTHAPLFPSVMKRKRSGIVPLFECEQCRKRFASAANALRHISCIHKKLRLFKCPEIKCRQTFSRLDNAMYHYRTVHLRIMPFDCKEQGCNLRFSVRGNLKKHVNEVHKGLRPFRCGVSSCYKRFKRKEHRAIHIRLVHWKRARTSESRSRKN